MAVPDSYPAQAREALVRLLDDLAPLAPEPGSLVVYGSVARGTHRDGESDVNLAVVLEDASPELLGRLRTPLRRAWRAARVEPFIVRREEIAGLADVFPLKLLELREHGDVIHGDDAFADVEVRSADLRLRVEQELRNHLLRFRRRYAMVGDQLAPLGDALLHAAPALAVQLGALLHLKQRPIDPGAGADAIFAAAAKAFDLDVQVLERLQNLKTGGDEPDVEGLYRSLLRVIARAVEVADRIQP